MLAAAQDLQTLLALTCFGLLAVGYAVVGGLWLWPPTRRTADDIRPILMTETIIVAVAAGAFLIGGKVLGGLVVAMILRCGYEAGRVVLRRAGFAVSAGYAVTVALLAMLGALLPVALFGPVALILLLAAAAARSVTPPGTGARRLAELALFPGVPLAVFGAAALAGMGGWLIAAFLLVETFDSYALLGGKLFGRRKAFPRLSPRKTVEGLVAGAVMLMLTAALAGWLLVGAPVAVSALVALLAGALSVTGDLAASRLKRAAGVKDYPQVMAHQGGLLDIADAWIVTGAGLTLLAALV